MGEGNGRLLERARVHFGDLGVKSIEIPEWGDEKGPAVIYVTPMTLAEKRKLYKTGANSDLGVLADVLILKAKDADGNKLFTIEDKHALLNEVDSEVLTRVAQEILAARPVDEHLKN